MYMVTPAYLDRSVVVVKVNSSDHLGSLEIADTQIDFRDDVTSDQLEDLSRRRKSGIDFDPRQLQSLRSRELFRVITHFRNRETSFTHYYPITTHTRVI